MSRRGKKRAWQEPHRELNHAALRGVRHSEIGPDGRSYQVQHVGPARKTYRCPGCQQEVTIGSEHAVVWPEETSFWEESGVNARRHWHNDCWRRGLRPR